MPGIWNWYLNRIAIWGSMGIGLVMAGLMFLLVRAQEDKQMKAEFDIAAQEAVLAYDREMDRNEDVVGSLAAFYYSSKEVEPDEFQRFAAAVVQRVKNLQALEWIPRVSQEQRAVFEEKARRLVDPAFQIQECPADAGGPMRRAGVRDEYFPVHLVEPMAGNAFVLGYDLASESRRRNAMEKARDSGRLTATEGIELMQGEMGYLLLFPIYSNSWVTTLAQRRAQLAGFCLGVVRVQDTVVAALESLSRPRLDFTLFDVGDSGKLRRLYHHPAGGSTSRPFTLPSVKQEEWTGLFHSHDCTHAGKAALVLVTPAPLFYQSFSRWRSWNVLAVGLLLTGGVTASLYRDRCRALHLQDHVARRTEELSSANGELRTLMEQHKEMEDALRVSAERYSLVISGVKDGIWDWDLQTNEVFFSPHWKSMLGYHEEEVANRLESWESLLHPDDKERALATVQAYLKGESPTYELEHRLRHKDGSYRWILARGIALRPPGRPPTRMVGSHVDITDRRHDEERLRQANVELERRGVELRNALTELENAHHELKSTQLQLIQSAKLESVGKLAAGVAHEVKNPLQTMLMGLTFLENAFIKSKAGLMNPKSQADLKEACQDMHEAITRANTIIRGLLQMSGTPNLQMEPTDINLLLRKALSLVNYNLDSSRVIAECDLQPDLSRLCVDSGKIEQVFINLFTNAIHAMPRGGTLTVRTYEQSASKTPLPDPDGLAGKITSNREVVVEVRDTGTGISPENMQMLFSPFFTTKEKGLGTGLGLSVTKSIVELHGGEIELSNRPEGGAQATLRFPIRKEEHHEKSTRTLCG